MKYRLVVASLMLRWGDYIPKAKDKNFYKMTKFLDQNGFSWYASEDNSSNTVLFVEIPDSLKKIEKLTHYKTSSSWDDQISLDIDFKNKLIIIHDDYIE